MFQIEACVQCGNADKVIACIEDPALINKILTHLRKTASRAEQACCHKVGHRLPICSADTPQFTSMATTRVKVEQRPFSLKAKVIEQPFSMVFVWLPPNIKHL